MSHASARVFRACAGATVRMATSARVSRAATSCHAMRRLRVSLRQLNVIVSCQAQEAART